MRLWVGGPRALLLAGSYHATVGAQTRRVHRTAVREMLVSGGTILSPNGGAMRRAALNRVGGSGDREGVVRSSKSSSVTVMLRRSRFY